MSWVRERSSTPTSSAQGMNSHQTSLVLTESSSRATGTSRGNAGPLLYLAGGAALFLVS